MKKLLTIAMLLLAGLIGNAQGTWSTTTTVADELKGQEAGEVMVYTVDGIGSFVCWGWNEYQFRLTSQDEQFNIQLVYNQFSGSYKGINVLVGIYDDNGKMVEKFNMWLDHEDNVANRFVRTRNAGTMSNPVGQKGKVKKIFKALQSGRGYVRIVAERFNTTDFDIKITPYK